MHGNGSPRWSDGSARRGPPHLPAARVEPLGRLHSTRGIRAHHRRRRGSLQLRGALPPCGCGCSRNLFRQQPAASSLGRVLRHFTAAVDRELLLTRRAPQSPQLMGTCSRGWTASQVLVPPPRRRRRRLRPQPRGTRRHARALSLPPRPVALAWRLQRLNLVGRPELAVGCILGATSGRGELACLPRLLYPRGWALACSRARPGDAAEEHIQEDDVVELLCRAAAVKRRQSHVHERGVSRAPQCRASIGRPPARGRDGVGTRCAPRGGIATSSQLSLGSAPVASHLEERDDESL